MPNTDEYIQKLHNQINALNADLIRKDIVIKQRDITILQLEQQVITLNIDKLNNVKP
jgi:hypothetical protein